MRLAFLLGMIVFKKNLGLSFNKGHGVYIVVNLHHRDVLPRVLFLIGVLHNGQLIAAANFKNNSLKRNTSIANQELVFVMVPVKNFAR